MESASGAGDSLVEVVPPDRRRIVVGDKIEMIAIGPRRWSKIDGVWTEQPSDGGLPPVGLSAEQLADGLLENARDLGTEALNGTQARVYGFEGSSDISGVTASQTLAVWIDASTGLPLKVEANVVAQGVDTKMSMTYEYSEALRRARAVA